MLEEAVTASGDLSSPFLLFFFFFAVLDFFVPDDSSSSSINARSERMKLLLASKRDSFLCNASHSIILACVWRQRIGMLTADMQRQLVGQQKSRIRIVFTDLTAIDGTSASGPLVADDHASPVNEATQHGCATRDQK